MSDEDGEASALGCEVLMTVNDLSVVAFEQTNPGLEYFIQTMALYVEPATWLHR